MSFSWSFNRIVVKRPFSLGQTVLYLLMSDEERYVRFFPSLIPFPLCCHYRAWWPSTCFRKLTHRARFCRVYRYAERVMKEKENLPVRQSELFWKTRAVMSETCSSVQLFFHNSHRALTAVALMIEKCAFKARMNSKAGLRRQINGKLFSFRGCFNCFWYKTDLQWPGGGWLTSHIKVFLCRT